MAAPKVMSGARAKLGIVDPATGLATYIGIFNSASYSLTYDAQPAYILGRYSPAEIDYTAQEPVQITCAGWRIIDSGPHAVAKVPALQDLLTHEYLSLVLTDRQTNKNMATFHFVRPTGYSSTVTARQLEEVTVTFVGILVDDESTQNSESASAVDLP